MKMKAVSTVICPGPRILQKLISGTRLVCWERKRKKCWESYTGNEVLYVGVTCII